MIKHRSTIFVKPISYKKEDAYQYTFYKNLELFIWLLSLPHFKYDKSRKLLYSPASEDLLEYIEAASEGAVTINKYQIHKELIEAGQLDSTEALTRFEIPKYSFDLRIIVKLASIEDEKCYLVVTEQIGKCKKLLEKADFISYSRRLSAFVMPYREVNLLKLLEACRGQIFVTLHQHVKIQSLYLQSCFWMQAYNTDLQVPEEYLKLLKSHNYSIKTIQNYFVCFFTFLSYCKSRDQIADELTPEEINDIVLKLSTCNYYSSSTTQMMINAVMYYYKNVLEKQDYKNKIHRPQKERTLPKVISKEEVEKIILNCQNLKHNTMLCLMYSAGLRAGEIINLKVTDVDSKRMLISIRKGKGLRDRTVMLSEKMLAKLRVYYKQYKPKQYLLEGQYGDQYSMASLRQVLSDACKKAGIRQKPTLHWLRHSFATHLLEGGTDIRLIRIRPTNPVF